MKAKLFYAGLLLMALTLGACNSNEPANSGDSISCDPESYEMSTGGGEFTVTIKSTSAWSATADQKWVELSPNTGQGDAFVNVVVSKGAAATATVLFSNGSGTATLKIGRGQTINTGDTETDLPAGVKDGAITNAVFEVNDAGKKVCFSQGNLQYQASTDTWCFSDNQYDYIGEDNKNISSSYNGWIDLFGWGTGANPTLATTENSDYSVFTDWGVNKISNGGNKANQWRTLTKEEWEYVTTKGSKMQKWVSVCGINGYLLLPLDFVTPSGTDLSSNSFSSSEWPGLQTNGAVFLPVAGDRNGTDFNGVGSFGNYWSSTSYYELAAWNFFFYSDEMNLTTYYRSNGQSVRLVQDL